MTTESKPLPDRINSILTAFVDSTTKAFNKDLRSIVLFGSGAEGNLRPASDVNVVVVLEKFDQTNADQMREPLRQAEAAINLKAMFLLAHEVEPASQAFAVKFADIKRRHVVLYGDDPFSGLSLSRHDSISRLKQTLLNQTLRLRESYISRGLREEQLIRLIADAAGPLRTCAATLLELEGAPATSSKEALQKISSSIPGLEELDQRISMARQTQTLPIGVPAITLFQLIELTQLMWKRAAALK